MKLTTKTSPVLLLALALAVAIPRARADELTLDIESVSEEMIHLTVGNIPAGQAFVPFPAAAPMVVTDTTPQPIEIAVDFSAVSFLLLQVFEGPGPDYVLYLPFDGDTSDRSPNGTDGINTGATLTQDRLGNPDQAYFFDGSGTEIHVPDGPSLDVTHLTLSFWFNMLSTETARELVNNFGSGGNIAYGSDYGSKIGKIDFRVSPGGTLGTLADLPTTTSITLDEWYHFTDTYDGAEMRVYINGSLDNSAPKSGAIFDSSANLRVGRYDYSSASDFHGSIDEVIVWDRALGAGEVAALYANGGKP